MLQGHLRSGCTGHCTRQRPSSSWLHWQPMRAAAAMAACPAYLEGETAEGRLHILSAGRRRQPQHTAQGAPVVSQHRSRAATGSACRGIEQSLNASSRAQGHTRSSLAAAPEGVCVCAVALHPSRLRLTFAAVSDSQPLLGLPSHQGGLLRADVCTRERASSKCISCTSNSAQPSLGRRLPCCVAQLMSTTDASMSSNMQSTGGLSFWRLAPSQSNRRRRLAARRRQGWRPSGCLGAALSPVDGMPGSPGKLASSLAGGGVKALGGWWEHNPGGSHRAASVYERAVPSRAAPHVRTHPLGGEIHESASRAAHPGDAQPSRGPPTGRSRLTIPPDCKRQPPERAAATCKAWSRSGAAMLELLFDRAPTELYSVHREYAGEPRRSLQPAGVWAGVLAPLFEREG